MHAGLVLMGGTLTSSAVVSAASQVQLRPGFPGWGGNGWWWVGLVVGTLLGPEGADASSDRASVVRRLPRSPGFSGGVGLGVRGEYGARVRPYLENCTVDASIFVAKLLRAHGGCLGTRSR